MAYSEVTAAEIDPESPLTTSLATKWRDNPLAIFEGDPTAISAGKGVAIDLNSQTAILTDENDTAKVLKPDGAGSAVWGTVTVPAATVGQSQLKTSTGEVSTGGSSNLTLAGGSYGFYPRIKVDNNTFGDHGDAYIGETFLHLSFTANIRLVAVGTTARAQQRYVTASPPYDLGDGEIPLFVFLRINKVTKKVISTYIADTPPWAYNGPTKIRPDVWTTDNDGKINTKALSVNNYYLAVENYNLKKALKVAIPKNEDIRLFSTDKKLQLRSEKILAPIDHERKNRDMALIPHPFVEDAEHEIVLVDPCETMGLCEDMEDGEDISKLIMDGYIEINNTELTRAMPNCVKAHGFSWKNTR